MPEGYSHLTREQCNPHCSNRKSNLRALVWLGADAFGNTEPQFQTRFNRQMAADPEHVQNTVGAVVLGIKSPSHTIGTSFTRPVTTMRLVE